jgi:hypothetical protein
VNYIYFKGRHKLEKLRKKESAILTAWFKLIHSLTTYYTPSHLYVHSNRSLTVCGQEHRSLWPRTVAKKTDVSVANNTEDNLSAHL